MLRRCTGKFPLSSKFSYDLDTHFQTIVDRQVLGINWFILFAWNRWVELNALIWVIADERFVGVRIIIIIVLQVGNDRMTSIHGSHVFTVQLGRISRCINNDQYMAHVIRFMLIDLSGIQIRDYTYKSMRRMTNNKETSFENSIKIYYFVFAEINL